MKETKYIEELHILQKTSHTAIIVVIIQPNNSLFKLFDKFTQLF